MNIQNSSSKKQGVSIPAFWLISLIFKFFSRYPLQCFEEDTVLFPSSSHLDYPDLPIVLILLKILRRTDIYREMKFAQIERQSAD